MKITLDGSPQGRTAFFTTPYLTGGPGGEQASKGTVEAGKLADLVILDKDPLKVDTMAVKDVKVVETVREGNTIYPVVAGAEKPVPVALSKSTKAYSWHAAVCDMSGVNQAAHKEWTLTALNGKEIAVEKAPTMTFEHGRLAIFAGVNRLTGSYALINNTFTPGSLVSTKMAGDPALMELESGLAKALTAGRSTRTTPTKPVTTADIAAAGSCIQRSPSNDPSRRHQGEERDESGDDDHHRYIRILEVLQAHNQCHGDVTESCSKAEHRPLGDALCPESPAGQRREHREQQRGADRAGS